MRKILMTTMMAMLMLLPSVALAQVEGKVRFVPSMDHRIMGALLPASLSLVTPGKDITIKGKVCVVDGSFTGTLDYSVWGVAESGKYCYAACYNCADYEACGGDLCRPPDVCLTNEPLGQQVCGAIYEDSTGRYCGSCPLNLVQCNTRMAAQTQNVGTLSEGQCSAEYTFRTTVGEDWERGNYGVHLGVMESSGWYYDFESRDVRVGMPRVNVQVLAFLEGATLLAAVGLIIRGVGLI